MTRDEKKAAFEALIAEVEKIPDEKLYMNDYSLPGGKGCGCVLYHSVRKDFYETRLEVEGLLSKSQRRYIFAVDGSDAEYTDPWGRAAKDEFRRRLMECL